MARNPSTQVERFHHLCKWNLARIQFSYRISYIYAHRKSADFNLRREAELLSDRKSVV